MYKRQVYGIEIPDVIEIIEVPPITAVPGVPSYIKGIINAVSYTHLDVYKRQYLYHHCRNTGKCGKHSRRNH